MLCDALQEKHQVFLPLSSHGCTLCQPRDRSGYQSDTSHCCQQLEIEALSPYTTPRGSSLYDGSFFKLLHIGSDTVRVSHVCMYSELFSSFSVQLNSYALTYDGHLAGLIEVLFTMCGGVTVLAFVCVCVAEVGNINVHYSPRRLAIAPRAWL